MDKLSKLQNIIEVLDKDTVTQDEFVEYFGILIDFVGQLQESNDKHIDEVKYYAKEVMDKCTEKMQTMYASEWAKVKSKVESLKDGKDYILTEEDKQEIAEMIVPPMFETPEKVIEIREQPIIKEVALKDSPEEIVGKVNESKTKINREQIEGLKDIENMAKANQMPVTTTHFYRSGSTVGRAKNIDFVGSRVELSGDRAIVTPIVVSDTAPSNPLYGELWLDIS